MKLNAAARLCTVLFGMVAVLIGLPGLIGAQELQKIPKPMPLAGTKWVLVESAGQRVPQNGWQPHFELKTLERYEDGSAGQVEGVADSCSNDLTGTYRVTANRLRVHNASLPLRTCKFSKDMPLETIGTFLDGNLQFQIHGSELDLLESNGVVRARFVAAQRD